MDPPPSYDIATSSAASQSNPGHTSSSHLLTVPKVRNGIPTMSRRSMEDESRDLPEGWVRQFDPANQHQFFVDTKADPPRSIWHHPYDDETYLKSLSSEERTRIRSLQKTPSQADIAAESSEDDEFHNPRLTGQPREHFPERLPERNSPVPTGIHKFGRKMKDKITSSTHEERELERQRRGQEEAETYRRHQAYREAMARAAETGEPQLIGKDQQGRDVYIEPPYGNAGGPIGGGGPYPGQGGYGHGGIGYNPYRQGPYGMPNARYLRPQAPYYRQGGLGYGGGLGLPLGLGLGAGLLGGSLLF